MPRFLAILFLCLPIFAFGQLSISGKVVSQADKKPVSFATVFISNTTVGANTTEDGSFILKNLKPGTYQLSVSFIGFKPFSQVVTLSDKNVMLQAISLEPSDVSLAEVQVKAKNDPDRDRNVNWFKEEFIGTDAVALKTKLQNPEMLDLQYSKGILTGSSVDFLQLQNDALGYKLKYLVQNFMLNRVEEDKTFSYSGLVKFEKLTGTTLQEKEWASARQKRYEGSLQHWLRSAIAGNLTQQGFKVMLVPRNPARPPQDVINSKIDEFTGSDEKGAKDSLKYWKKMAALPAVADQLAPDTLKVKDYLTGPDASGTYVLDGSKGSLFVMYDKTHYFTNTTLTRFRDNKTNDVSLLNFVADKIFFDKNGAIINPTDINVEGVWAKNRVSGLLPIDYEPVGDENSITDSSQLKRIAASLTNYTAGNRLEKAYLHLDKPYYAAGDTIYFKAYVTQGAERTLSNISGIVDVDIIGPENKEINHVKLPLLDGMAWGDFALPDNLLAGQYRLRAYTRWMRNRPANIFYEDVTIAAIAKSETNAKAPAGKPVSVTAKASSARAAKPDVQFLPEGGKLLTGFDNLVGVKITNPDGKGAAIKEVRIIDDKNKQVAIISGFHAGMSSFTFKPEDGHTYTGNVTYADGTTQQAGLPPPVKDGLLLHVDAVTDKENLLLKIAQGKTDMVAPLSLVGTANGRIYFAAKVLAGQPFETKVPKSNFPTGVIQFTIFTSDGEPLNERLAFINNADDLRISLTPATATHTPRQKENIAINVKDATGNTVSGGFSVAVINENVVPVKEDDESTILTELLLQTDLKGYIEQPNYYFAHRDDKALDNLMLTQGYRDFAWKKVLHEPVTYAYAPEKGMAISGVAKTPGGKALANTKLQLVFIGGFGSAKDTLTDAQGHFTFSNLAFTNGTRFVIKQADEKQGTMPAITLDSVPPLPVDLSTNWGSLAEDDALTTYKTNSRSYFNEKMKYGMGNSGKMLNEVVIKGNKDPNPVKQSANLNGAGRADQVFTAKEIEDMSCTSLYMCLQMKLTNVISRGGKFFLPKTVNVTNGLDKIATGGLRPGVRLSGQSTPDNDVSMQIVVNGDIVDYAILNTIPPSAVQSIEVVRQLGYGAAYGSRGKYGLIIITLKTGAQMSTPVGPGMKQFKLQGFYKARDFYMPRYDVAPNNTMNDLRTTIFWKPDIITGSDGKAEINYFNADTKGTYRVVIEGIDVNGNLGRYVYRYEVK